MANFTAQWARNVLAGNGIDPHGPFVDITDALQDALERCGVSNDDYEAERIALELAGKIA